METWIKCGIMGLTIWVLLFLAFYISDYLVKCSLPTNDSGSPLVGSSCWNSIQGLILMIFAVLSFPFLLVGANPNMTTVGPFVLCFFGLVA